MPKLNYVEGIGPSFETKLNAVGIKTTGGLLKIASTKKGRKTLASQTEISEKMILEWTNHCDLLRIKGVGAEYADLLEAAGVDTVPELANRNAQNLLKQLTEVNITKKLVRQLPTIKMVELWIGQAKTLPRIIEY
jgi:predicted flap endonuclease-1-like 5' DNA nuclease